MIFVETPIFTAQIKALVSDEEYATLQRELAADPEAGDVIVGTGGLRKIRMAAKGKGKRGGARVIYFYFMADDRIAMLLAYCKGVKDDLSAKEKRILAGIIKTWRHAR
ncbi:MAG TPA: type II toxin-antitoxin system RelE/ParE family toxin [Rhodanobacteraceae bacterium]